MKEKLLQEKAAWERRLAANEKNNLQAGIDKAKKEIARIDLELNKLDEVKSEEKFDPKPKKEKPVKVKKGRGVKILLPDAPKKSANDIPNCDELLEKFRAKAKARIEAKKKRKVQENKPEPEKIVNSVEKAAEATENKVEKAKEDKEKMTPSQVKEVVFDIKKIVSEISKITDKQLIRDLIEELKKLL